MKAWDLDAERYADLAIHIRSFTESFCRDAHAPDAASSAAIAAALARLEPAFERTGATLADQMAFHSECAHGWWEMVVPAPQDSRDRPGVPRWKPGMAFWEAGAAPYCAAG
jgi:hypothetical protein